MIADMCVCLYVCINDYFYEMFASNQRLHSCVHRKSGLLRKKKRRDTTVIKADKKSRPRKNWDTLLNDEHGNGQEEKALDANAWQQEETGTFFGWLTSFFAA